PDAAKSVPNLRPPGSLATIVRSNPAAVCDTRGMRRTIAILFLVASPIEVLSQTALPEPIIDVHLHAVRAGSQGPPPVRICAPMDHFPAWDPQTGGSAYGKLVIKTPPCARPLQSAATDEELMRRTLDIMQSRNVTGVASGPVDVVEMWKKA